MYTLLFFLPALLVVIGTKLLFKHDINNKELLYHFLAAILGTVLCFGILYLVSSLKTHDTEIWNGYVTDKQRKEVSCNHMYQCGQTCTTDSKGAQTCVPIYCPEHSYDVDWKVNTTVGSLYINRIDEQGIKEPPRWARVSINEPASIEHGTTNYLLLTPESYETTDAIREKYKDKIPKYPEVTDYYRINRVITDTNQYLVNINEWLNDKLRVDGAKKQLNIVIVLTKQKDPEFFNALYDSWRGGKKNDVILVYGVDQYNNVKWFRASSFANGQDNQLMISKLNEAMLDTAFNLDTVKRAYSIITENFTRLPNESFSYMASILDPSIGLLLFCMFVNLLISITLAVVFIKEDIR